jgi:amino acid transporter
MMIHQVIFAAFVALIVTVLFSGVLKKSGPWQGMWYFFAFMMLVALAAARWIRPAGYAFYEIYWIPIVIVVVIFAILFLAISPSQEPRKHKATEGEDVTGEDLIEERKSSYAGSFYWFLVVVLFVAIMVSYITDIRG